jgi:hypothetical protein
MFPDPDHCTLDILHRCREQVCRCEAVVDAEDHISMGGQCFCNTSMVFFIATLPGTAVDGNDCRAWSWRCREIDITGEFNSIHHCIDNISSLIGLCNRTEGRGIVLDAPHEEGEKEDYGPFQGMMHVPGDVFAASSVGIMVHVHHTGGGVSCF